MTHVICRLTAKNRDQLRNPTLGDRVWATFSASCSVAAAHGSIHRIRQVAPMCTTTWFRGPTRSTLLINGMSIGSVVSARLAVVTNTHRQTTPCAVLSVAMSRGRGTCEHQSWRIFEVAVCFLKYVPQSHWHYQDRFKCVEALGRIIIGGQSGGVPVWLSVWSKVQPTQWSTYKLCDIHAIFYYRLSVSKSIFLFPYVIFLYCFCGDPLVVESPGQLPSLPPSP